MDRRILEGCRISIVYWPTCLPARISPPSLTLAMPFSSQSLVVVVSRGWNGILTRQDGYLELRTKAFMDEKNFMRTRLVPEASVLEQISKEHVKILDMQ